ncbi:hypothetical protein [Nocardia otitidiscaviarum]|nr:hypothetical protein [Nocardia otitidiscaviarum]
MKLALDSMAATSVTVVVGRGGRRPGVRGDHRMTVRTGGTDRLTAEVTR